MVKNIISGQHSATGRWYASCYSPDNGDMTQWGATETEAMDHLIVYATCVMGETWPDLGRNDVEHIKRIIFKKSDNPIFCETRETI